MIKDTLNKVLVTGGAGFIGSNLVAECLRRGLTVDVVDDLSNGRLEFISGLKGQMEIYMTDFSAPAVLRRIQDGDYDAVFHLAAVPRVSYSVEHPVETHETNVEKSLLLLDAVRLSRSTKLIFASSSSVYGGADVLPTSETYVKSSKSPYALQKSIIEDYIRLYAELYGTDAVALRFFNVFGRNQLGNSPYSTAISAWLTAIARNESMRSDGDGTQSRDMCHVDNVVSACLLAATSQKNIAGEVFNVACGDRTTNNQILEYLLSKYPNAKFHTAPWRVGDVMHTQADISKSQEVLGYRPIVRIWQGIDDTIDWYQKNEKLIKGIK
jgi:nucleoside-diphosphate-sugar epimerase